MQTYLFYDIETTGLNHAFDQVLHFAAIRTDLNLNELTRYELKIRLNPDIIPAPAAVITHRISIEAMQEGISEFAAIKQIHQWLNQPGTISLGYNTLGFDDEFLRFSFYRNLLPPYTHQYANQCKRMDIYPMTLMYFLFKNEVLEWPQKDGKNSLKLEDLNKANQFVSQRSHHAMADVEATLALARVFFNERTLWDFLSNYFDKKAEQKFLDSLPKQQGLLIDGRYREQAYQCPVLFLGNHRHYKNQTLWLRLDTENFTQNSLDSCIQNTKVIYKKLGEPAFILPLKERFLKYCSSENLARFESHYQWLQERPELLQKITEHHANFTYPQYPNVDIEASLYLNGFWNSEEEHFCRRFHAANDQDKAKLTQQNPHPQLKQLALRILGRNFAHTLNAELRAEFTQDQQRIHPFEESAALNDYRNEKRLTPKKALNQIRELQQKPNLDSEQLALLAGLESYLNKQFRVL